MKRTLLFAIAMASLFSGLQAQTEYKTYDASDANLDTKVNVGDAVHVANHAMDEKPDRNIVTATNAYDVLVNLNSYFETVGYTTEAIHALDARLSALESLLGIAAPPSPEPVDLGVVVNGKPVYWANMNIGAEGITDYGLQFAWGETTGYSPLANDQHKFDWFTYTNLSEGDEMKMTKYCVNDAYGQKDGKCILEPEDDAAHVMWGGAWRMPTIEEFNALREQCEWCMETILCLNGEEVLGYFVKNKKDPDKYIFLPMKEYELNGGMAYEGSYWTSSLYVEMCNHAWYYGISNSDLGNFSNFYKRCEGFAIRPVCNE